MIPLSLPRDTPLALPGGTWELRDGEWVRTEDPRWWYENGRIRADYTHEEAAIAVGMMGVNGGQRETATP
jgi:hypothetical protein